MATYLSPISNDQVVDSIGAPLVGGYWQVFLAGTSTPVTTYTDSTGITPQPTSITLDASGRPANPIWLSGGVPVKFRLFSAAAVPLLTVDNVSGINDPAGITAQDQWVLYGAAPTYVSATSFSVVGDQTNIFQIGRRLKSTNSGGTVYSSITNSVYGVVTTVTVTNDSGTLDSGMSAVSYGLLSATSTSVPTNIARAGNNTDIVSLRGLTDAALAPTNNVTNGSLGLGPINSVTTRTGGYGQYGNWLSQYLVTDGIPAAEFDVGIASWVTVTNMTAAGAAVFGGWSGANTPSAGLGQTFTGGGAFGLEVNVGNRWNDFGLQADVGGTRYTVGLQVVADVLPALDGLDTKSVTITNANPGVVTLNSHGAAAGTGIVFQGSGTLPSPLVKGTTYFISATGLTANTFQISATVGGASIDTSAGTFAGPITALISWPGSFAVMYGPSVHGHRWWTASLTRYDSIMPGGYVNRDYGGSVAGQVPLAHTRMDGFWTNGIDFSNGSFANACLKFGAGQVSGTATAGGGVALPATVNGFLIVDVSGVLKRIPYYNA